MVMRSGTPCRMSWCATSQARSWRCASALSNSKALRWKAGQAPRKDRRSARPARCWQTRLTSIPFAWNPTTTYRSPCPDAVPTQGARGNLQATPTSRRASPAAATEKTHGAFADRSPGIRARSRTPACDMPPDPHPGAPRLRQSSPPAVQNPASKRSSVVPAFARHQSDAWDNIRSNASSSGSPG